MNHTLVKWPYPARRYTTGHPLTERAAILGVSTHNTNTHNVTKLKLNIRSIELTSKGCIQQMVAKRVVLECVAVWTYSTTKLLEHHSYIDVWQTRTEQEARLSETADRDCTCSKWPTRTHSEYRLDRACVCISRPGSVCSQGCC